jgi:hypothetical protein
VNETAGGAAASELSVRAILGEALRLYRRHWRLLVPLAVAVLLPQAIVDSIGNGLEIERLESFGDFLKLIAIPFTVVISLGGEALLAGVITALVLQWRLGHPLPGVLAFAASLAWVRLITVDLLLAVGAAIGIVLLVVPGLLFLTYFSIAPAMIEIEDRRVGAAMKRSASLVRGRARRIFVLFVGVIFVTEGFAQLLLLAFHGFLPQLASEVAVDALLESVQGLVIALVAISLIEIHGEAVPAARIERTHATAGSSDA